MMTRTRGFVLLGSLLLLSVVLAGSKPGLAEPSSDVFTPSSRFGLRSLKGFYVQVDRLPFDVEQRGLYKSELQREVELRMRKAGAVVLMPEDGMATPGVPRLHVRILASKQHNSPYYAYCIVLNFDQPATLSRDNSISVDATTWSRTRLGMIKKGDMPELREVVATMADDFLNAYLAENPRH